MKRRPRLIRAIRRNGVLEGAIIEIDPEDDSEDDDAKPIIVIGARDKDVVPFSERPASSEQRPCSVCLALCWVTATSRAYMAKGLPLMCLECGERAASKRPRN